MTGESFFSWSACCLYYNCPPRGYVFVKVSCWIGICFCPILWLSNSRWRSARGREGVAYRPLGDIVFGLLSNSHRVSTVMTRGLLLRGSIVCTRAWTPITWTVYFPINGDISNKWNFIVVYFHLWLYEFYENLISL